MDYESIFEGQETVSIITSPISEDIKILIMLDGDTVLRLYLLVREEENFLVHHEILAFEFSSKNDALEFAHNINEMSALDLILTLDPNRNFYT